MRIRSFAALIALVAVSPPALTPSSPPARYHVRIRGFIDGKLDETLQGYATRGATLELPPGRPPVEAQTAARGLRARVTIFGRDPFRVNGEYDYVGVSRRRGAQDHLHYRGDTFVAVGVPRVIDAHAGHLTIDVTVR